MSGFGRRLQQGVIIPSAPTTPPGPPGTYKPDSTTTGYAYTGVTLTPHSGDYNITTDGTVLDSLDISGWVVVNAANVTIKRCYIRGGAAKSFNTGLIDCTGANCSNLTVQDCLLLPDHPTLWYDGIIGHDYTIQRCEIYHTVDGCGVYNTHNSGGPVNTNIYANYIHSLAGYLVDPNHSNGPTHNDCIQPQGGNNVKIIGNNLQGFVSSTVGSGASWNDGNGQFSGSNGTGGLHSQSCIQLNENTANLTSGILINSNWADGAHIAWNLATGPPSSHLDQVNNNKFGNNTSSNLQINLRSTQTTGSLTGNVFEVGGGAVNIHTNG